jgi:phage tail-like protein
MRGHLTALASPHPLARVLPGLYQDEAFVERFCSALDEVLAPVVSTLDNWPYYLDVATAPEDLLPWLAAWTGMSVDPGQSRDRQRLLLRQAVALHGSQGTRRGIEMAVEAVFGLRAEVQETGAATWSMEADAPIPGEPQQAFVLQVFAPAGAIVDEERLDLVVEGLKPAHVVHRVEVVRS